MTAVDLSTVVWFDENGAGTVTSEGHLQMPNDWPVGPFGFPSIYFSPDQTYKVQVSFTGGGDDAEVDMYSLLSVDQNGYDNSNMDDLGWAYASGGTPNASLVNGLFTAYILRGVANVSYAFDNAEFRVLWYATPGMKITRITWEQVELARSDPEQGPDETVTIGTFNAESQDTWSTEGQYFTQFTNAPGAGLASFAPSEVSTALQEASKWPPPTSNPQVFLSGNAFSTTWQPFYSGPLNDPATHGITELYAKHEWKPRTFNAQRSFSPYPWPEGAIGYEWVDSNAEPGMWAQQECLTLKLKLTSTALRSDSRDTTTDPASYPSYVTQVIVAPVALDSSNTSKMPTPPSEGDFFVVTEYTGGGEVAEYVNIPLTSGGDVELLDHTYVDPDGRRQGVIMTRTITTNPPAGPISGSLFSAPDVKRGAYLWSAAFVATFRPPQYRWILTDPAPPPTSISAGSPRSRRDFT